MMPKQTDSKQLSSLESPDGEVMNRSFSVISSQDNMGNHIGSAPNPSPNPSLRPNSNQDQGFSHHHHINSQTVASSAPPQAVADPTPPRAVADHWQHVLFCLSGEKDRQTMRDVFNRLFLYHYSDGVVTFQAANFYVYEQVNRFHITDLRDHMKKLKSKQIIIKDVLVIEPSDQVEARNNNIHFTQSLHQVSNPQAANSNRVNNTRPFQKERNRILIENPFAEDDDKHLYYKALAEPIFARHRFDHFLENVGNMPAFAAARRIANEADDGAPMPLVLYGDIGCGKSHLLHAIAHEITENNPNIRVLHCSANQFKHQFSVSAQRYKVTNMREMIRHIDVLLIDDLHHFPVKHKGLEEFRYIIEEFQLHGKRVIITSYPKLGDLEGFPPALMARLMGGLSIKIGAPDAEMCLQILEKELEFRQASHLIDYDGLRLITAMAPNSVRESIGILNGLIHNAQLQGRPWSQAEIGDYIHNQLGKSRRITSAQVISKVCQYYGFQREDMRAGGKERQIVRARHVAMYLLKTMTSKSYPEIGRDLGGFDHTTVMYGTNKIKRLLAKDTALTYELSELERTLKYNF